MCFLIFSHPSFGQTIAFDPLKQQHVSVEDSAFRVSLVRREPCRDCPSVSRFVFEVTNKAEELTGMFVLENETAQVDEIRLAVNGKLVVIGRVLANTNIVTIGDLQTAKTVDYFFCFRPALSPDNRFIAYVKVYPAHFSENVSAQYLLYDLQNQPKENRRGKVSLENHIDVGHAFFPAESRNEPGDNLNVPPDRQHTMASQAFYWSRDSKTLLFVDRADRTNSAVFANISGWPNAPSVNVVPLQTQELVDPERCHEFQDRLEEAFHAVGVTWVADRQVKLHFRSMSPSCLRRQSLQIPFPN